MHNHLYGTAGDGGPLGPAEHRDYEATIERNVIKVFGWYDNEWGYANRLVELAALMGGR